MTTASYPRKGDFLRREKEGDGIAGGRKKGTGDAQNEEKEKRTSVSSLPEAKQGPLGRRKNL